MAAPAEQRVVDNVPNGLYIGGEWRDATASATLEVRDPSTAEVICEVADASPDDGAAALAAAADAQPDWAARPPRERGEILRRAFH
ncbi:MAG: aldehyde dehydrogenase family protein, partial [Jiangellaceae bacterium]